MSLFLTLLLSHLVADFPLQWNALVRMKQNGQAGLIIHSSMHVIVASLLLQEPLKQWPLLLVLGTIHWLIDWTKVSLPNSNTVWGFLLDQVAHLVSILLIVSIYGLFFQTSPAAILPDNILTAAVVYGIVIGIMVFVWVWANSQSEEVIQSVPIIQWTQAQMLQFSQQLGMALIGALLYGLYHFSFVNQFPCC
ncbi:MAG: DUF3307 domain-containing protein [Chloroflexota bacterium]